MKIPDFVDESKFKSGVDTCLPIHIHTIPGDIPPPEQDRKEPKVYISTLLGWNLAPLPGERGTVANDSLHAHAAGFHDTHRHPASVELHDVMCEDTPCKLAFAWDGSKGPIPQRKAFPDADVVQHP